MTVWQMRFPLEDGMKVIAEVRPKLTNWGKFSLTVEKITRVVAVLMLIGTLGAIILQVALTAMNYK